jgi:hypothetical protein
MDVYKNLVLNVDPSWQEFSWTYLLVRCSCHLVFFGGCSDAIRNEGVPYRDASTEDHEQVELVSTANPNNFEELLGRPVIGESVSGEQ